MRRVLVLLLEIAGFVLLGFAALITSVLLHIEVPLARRGVGTWLSDVASGAIRGALVISHIERMSPGIIVARGVILFDGEGHRIAYGERLTLTPDWDELLHLRVAFSSARLENAQVQLIDKGDGLPTLVTTFDSQTPHPDTGAEPLHVTIDNIELWQVTLSGDLLGLNGFRADDLHALGRLDIGREVYARIDHAHATLNRPFGFPGVVDSLTGVISTAPKDGVYLRARTHRGKERASGSVRYAIPKEDPKGPQRLTIRVRGTDISVSTLHGLGYDWAPDIAVPISGRFVLRGPTENFELTAAVQTSAGNADVRGSIADATGVSVSLRTEALKLAEVFPDYPNVTARGLLRIEAKPGVEDPTLHAEVEPVMFGSIALPAFNADGAMLDAGLRIDRLQARSKTARVDGHGTIAKNGALEFDIVASFPEIANEMNLRKAVPNARGRLDADLHIATPQIGMTKLNLSGRVTLRNFRYARLEADRLELRGSARGDPERPQLSVRVTGAQVRVDDYVLGDPTLALQGGPRAYTADGQFASAGKRTFNMHAQIRAERDAFTIDADPIEFSVGSGSWRGALSGLRIVGDKAVELGNLRLASRSQRLEARGVLRFDGDDELQAELQDFDLAALHALFGDRMLLSHGRADAHLELTGDIKDPEVHLQGALRNGIVRGIAGVNALYLIAYSAGRIEANGEVDLANRGLLRVDGSGEIDRTLADPLRALELGAYDIALSGQAIDLGLLPQLHAAKVTGTLGCQLRLQGAPQDPIVSGSVQLDQLTIPGGDPMSIVAEGGFDSGTVHAQLSIADERGALASAGATLHLDWSRLREHPDQWKTMLLGGPWQVTGETIARRLDRMPRPIPELAPYPAAIATRFALRKDNGDATGSIDFNLGWQEPFDAEEGCAPGTRAQADGRIALEHGNATISAKVFAGKAQVGTIEIGLDAPVDRWLENARIDRPRLLRANADFEVAAMQEVPYLCEYGNGSLRAQFEVDNALTSTPTLAVSVDARFSPKVARQAGRSQMRQRGCEDDPIRMRLYAKADSAELSGSGQLEGCHGGTADMSGRMAVGWDRWLVLPTAREDGPLEGLIRFDGAHLEPVLDRIPGVLNAGAVARGEVEISGTPRHTRTSGQIDITKGHMYLVATGQELNEIDARVSFRGDWAKLDYLKASAGKGRLEASGGFGFEGIRPSHARLALRARKLPIKREGIETAQITGSGVLDAEIGKEGSRVAIDLHDLAVSLPETSGRTLQGLDPNPDVVIVTQAEAPRVRSYPIDFRIRGERQITVRRSDFDTTVAIDLAVHWEPPDLNVGGSIAFREGEFEVFGKRFQINSGALRFNGETEFNPDVYLSAVEKPEASGLSPVYVSVTGTLAEPEVTFSSDACPGESGAITYLLSGRCDADDQDLAQESADAQTAFTSGVLSGVLTLGAQSQLKDFAPRVALGTTAAGNQRAGIGFASETLIPKFMRKLVHRVYIEGAVAGTASQNATAPETSNESITPDFLIELYFPHNIVGSGRFSPVTWGVDALWEP